MRCQLPHQKAEEMELAEEAAKMAGAMEAAELQAKARKKASKQQAGPFWDPYKLSSDEHPVDPKAEAAAPQSARTSAPFEGTSRSTLSRLRKSSASTMGSSA